jgi:hypothetical protein
MLISRIFCTNRLTRRGFVLVKLFISSTFYASEVLMPPGLSIAHEPLEGRYTSPERIFQPIQQNPTIKDSVNLIVN